MSHPTNLIVSHQTILSQDKRFRPVQNFVHWPISEHDRLDRLVHVVEVTSFLASPSCVCISLWTKAFQHFPGNDLLDLLKHKMQA